MSKFGILRLFILTDIQIKHAISELPQAPVSKCGAIDMIMIYYSHASKTHFHNKGPALGLALKVRGF